MIGWLAHRWHHFTHQHATLAKAGLCEIDLCYSRLRRRARAHISFDGDEFGPIQLHLLTLEDSKLLFAAQTPMEMRRIAVKLRGGTEA